MIRGLYTSSAGMQVDALRQEQIANNLANLDTAGFKRDMTIAQARRNMQIARTNNPTSAGPFAGQKSVPIGPLGLGVFVDQISKRFDQGTLRQTGNPLDLGLQGDGFFTMQDAKGQTFYSRAGNFSRDTQGHLIDQSGRMVMGTHGPITMPADAPDGKLGVTLDGVVSVGGQPVDRLAIARFANPDSELFKTGDTAFQANATAQVLPASAEVHQGTIEQANVNSVREMVEMITVMREYESNSKAVQAQDETLNHAVNDIAKA